MNQNQRILDTAVAAGELLLKSGAEIFRVQDTMLRLMKAFGGENCHVYIISNGFFASVGEGGPSPCTAVRHVPLDAVHLKRIAAVNSLSRSAEQGALSLAQAQRELSRIAVFPAAPPWAQILASGVGSACFCYIFGGDGRDSFAAFLLGLLLYAALLPLFARRTSKIITNLLGGALVSLAGFGLLSLGVGHDIDRVLIGAIIPLVPGVSLTTSVRSFLNGDYLSGIIQLIDALLVAACIAAGVGSVMLAANLLGWRPV
ncbi:MAG: threonine/serine exporter family protein [Oscillospiraceae bacterium]|nr:threonine/serine exporter family protein [Oscillospiraceae bacterium]